MRKDRSALGLSQYTPTITVRPQKNWLLKLTPHRFYTIIESGQNHKELVTVKRSISRKMSREEVIASMADKLAEGSAVKAKKKFHRKIHLINLVVILLSGTMVLLVSISMPKKPLQQKQSRSFLQTASAMQNPLLKLKSAFQNGAIMTDEYALYMAYLLVRYDSVPEKFRTPRPKIIREEVYAELDRIWGRISLRMRQKITDELLPQLRSKVQ